MLLRSDPSDNPATPDHAPRLRWTIATITDRWQEVWVHHHLTILPLDRPVRVAALVAELDLLLASGFGCAPSCGSHWLRAGGSEPLLEITQWERAIRLTVPIYAIAPITVDCAEFHRATQHFIDQFRAAAR